MWDPNYMKGVTTDLMTGKIPVDAVFNQNPLGSLYKRRKPRTNQAIQVGPEMKEKSTNTDQLVGQEYRLTEEIRDLFTNMEQKMNSLIIQSMENSERINALEQQLKDLVPVIKMGKNIEYLTKQVSELLAKYEHLVISTGRTTAPAAAFDAYLKENGRPPSNPAIFKDLGVACSMTKPSTNESTEISDAGKKVSRVLELNEETFAKPQMNAKDLALLIFSHLPGNNTPFHILAQVIAKIAAKDGETGALLDTFHQYLSEGDNAQAALTRIVRQVGIFTGRQPPTLKIKSLTLVPRPCQKSLRAVPPKPQLDKGWVCIYESEDGDRKALKI
ncbi:polymerase cofactor VP35 [Dianlovirus menglaense]|uniref:polymerase cofactor VP35 n=1 Tax=Dianlovirus menglaense TaxID=3052181 RepID=UPI000F6F0ECA|nr:polymerase cofactor VP35 [Dianlovirus menglaense]